VVLVGLKPISVANWLPSCFDAVGWVIWPVNIVAEMTYKVSSVTLNLCSLTGSSGAGKVYFTAQKHMALDQRRWRLRRSFRGFAPLPAPLSKIPGSAPAVCQYLSRRSPVRGAFVQPLPNFFGLMFDIILVIRGVQVPRTDWVLKWPGQLVIAGCQTFWTTEVSEALEQGDLEGYVPNLLSQVLHCTPKLFTKFTAEKHVQLAIGSLEFVTNNAFRKILSLRSSHDSK